MTKLPNFVLLAVNMSLKPYLLPFVTVQSRCSVCRDIAGLHTVFPTVLLLNIVNMFCILIVFPLSLFNFTFQMIFLPFIQQPINLLHHLFALKQGKNRKGNVR